MATKMHVSQFRGGPYLETQSWTSGPATHIPSCSRDTRFVTTRRYLPLAKARFCECPTIWFLEERLMKTLFPIVVGVATLLPVLLGEASPVGKLRWVGERLEAAG